MLLVSYARTSTTCMGLNSIKACLALAWLGCSLNPCKVVIEAECINNTPPEFLNPSSNRSRIRKVLLACWGPSSTWRVASVYFRSLQRI